MDHKRAVQASIQPGLQNSDMHLPHPQALLLPGGIRRQLWGRLEARLRPVCRGIAAIAVQQLLILLQGVGLGLWHSLPCHLHMRKLQLGTDGAPAHAVRLPCIKQTGNMRLHIARVQHTGQCSMRCCVRVEGCLSSQARWGIHAAGPSTSANTSLQPHLSWHDCAGVNDHGIEAVAPHHQEAMHQPIARCHHLA